MSILRKSDGSFRWLLVLGLIELGLLIDDLMSHGFNDSRWVGRLCLLIGICAAVPLDDPRYKARSLDALRTPFGVVAVIALTVSFGLLITRIASGK